MTREEAKQLLPIIKAYSEGKVIQEISCAVGDTWHDMDNLQVIDLNLNRYRVKPEPKYRPFANAKECWQEMQKHQPFGWIKTHLAYLQVVEIWIDRVFLGADRNLTDYNIASQKYTFPDGTPFGIKVEEHPDD